MEKWLYNRTHEDSIDFIQMPESTWWRHQMKTFSALLAICSGISPVTGAFPAQRPVTRIFDVFFGLLWINGSVNNREASDLRRYHAHYDVIVMKVQVDTPRAVPRFTRSIPWLLKSCIDK